MVNITFDASGVINWYNPATNSIQVYNQGNIAWIIAATALVWIMIPGVGFFYSGLLRRKNALSMIWLSMVTLAVVSFQWFFWGFSLAFSDSAGPFIGNLRQFPPYLFILSQNMTTTYRLLWP
jgi:Amt family ammonium transporter